MASVEQALTQRGWKYGRLSNESILTGVGASGRRVAITIWHDRERQTLALIFNVVPADDAIARGAFCAHASRGWSPEALARVCQLLAHRNYHILLGRWGRDSADGEIRLTTALPYRDASVTPGQINWCIDSGVAEVLAVHTELEHAAPFRLAV